MSWYPVGPDSVFAPRDIHYNRLSRRNEFGVQGVIYQIAVDPQNSKTLYAVTNQLYRTAIYKSTDGGLSWTCITDTLYQSFSNALPTWIAVHPKFSDTLYVACFNTPYLCVTHDGGGTWAGTAFAANVNFVVVDPNQDSATATTVVYAGADDGVYRSTTGASAGSFTNVQAGQVSSLLAVANGATTDLYAGIRTQGIFHSQNGTAWTNLNGQNIGLPASPANKFDLILMDYCPNSPARVYAWIGSPGSDSAHWGFYGLYTTSAATTSWSQVATSVPADDNRNWVIGFGVAGNSPGDGLKDVLFFGAVNLYRSIDAGKTWTTPSPQWDDFHSDHHNYTSSGATLYYGTDGGMCRSKHFNDRTIDISQQPTDYSEALVVSDSYSTENLNHGMPSCAIYQYWADATGAVQYIGCQDSGMAQGYSSSVWRAVIGADVNAVAMKLGNDGVHCFFNVGWYGGWPNYSLHYAVDNGSLQMLGWPGPGEVDAGIGRAGGTTNLVIDPSGNCLSGIESRTALTTVSIAVTGSTTAQNVTPVSMAGITANTMLLIDDEEVLVLNVTATTFHAVVPSNHGAGAPITAKHAFVATIADGGALTQISGEFSAGNNQVSIVANHWTTTDTRACVVGSPGNPWAQTQLWTSTAAPTWTQASTNQPANSSVASITYDVSGDFYALTMQGETVGTVTTALFKIVGGAWQAQTVTGLPTSDTFLKVVADPVQSGVLYVAWQYKLYTLTRSGGTWTAVDISDNLPQQWLTDLRAVAAGGGKVLLRAVIPSRGIWERDVSAGAQAPHGLYLRHHELDQGWALPTPQGMNDPFAPANQLWHYMSPDIKVDTQQIGPAGNFFQTDPEDSTFPIDHVEFEQLVDASQTLAQNATAWVHVQAHNRSLTAANNVTVWALYCEVSAGVPSLDGSPSQPGFHFWSMFQANGTIDYTQLPNDSPWKPVGAPKTLSSLDAAHPRVASWNWTVPTLSTGDLGHYCMIAILHSQASPVAETSANVDAISDTNPQVCQRNMHIVVLPPAPPGPTPPPRRRELPIQLHNPIDREYPVTVVLDLRGLPRTVRALVELKGVKIDPALVTGCKCMSASIIETTGGARAEIHKVIIPPRKYIDALIVIDVPALPPSVKPLRFDLQQWNGKQMIGGSSFLLHERIDKPQRIRPMAKPENEEGGHKPLPGLRQHYIQLTRPTRRRKG